MLYVAAADAPEVALVDAMRDGAAQRVLRVVGEGEDATAVPRSLLQREGERKGFEEQSQQAMRALLPVAPGMLITAGGADCAIRTWNAVSPDESYAVSGGMGRTVRHSTLGGVPLLQDLGPREAAGGTAHRDAVQDVCITPNAEQRVMVSGGRDGVVKVWK